MPVAVAPDDIHSAGSPDPSVVAGYTDCLKEALRFLLERERLPPQHPAVAGLALHLARPDAPNRRRARPEAGGLSTPSRRRTGTEERTASYEHRIRRVRNTASLGKAHATPRHKHVTMSSPNSTLRRNNASLQTAKLTDVTLQRTSESLSTAKSTEEGSQRENAESGTSTEVRRDINAELRQNLQTIVDNLQLAIEGEESDVGSADEEDVELEYEEEEEEGEDVETEEIDDTIQDPPLYDLNDSDLDAEIDTILGDSTLRRELVRLVYQGSDLIATAPLQPSIVLPTSPLIGATAETEYHIIPQHFH